MNKNFISTGRKKLRLDDFDYSSEGAYFVTICTKNRACVFGEIVDGEMVLSDFGKIAHEFWEEIPLHFSDAVLGEFVVIPNHIHGIVFLVEYDAVGNNDRYSPHRNMEYIPKIISQFKSSITHKIRKKFDDFSFAWQKSFHDRIIRNENELIRIREYIVQNPLRWESDENDLSPSA